MEDLSPEVYAIFFLVVYRVLGIACDVIKPKDIAKLHPLVNIHDLVGALHLPRDAVVSAPDVNHALAMAAVGHGEIFYYLWFVALFFLHLELPLYLFPVPFCTFCLHAS